MKKAEKIHPPRAIIFIAALLLATGPWLLPALPFGGVYPDEGRARAGPIPQTGVQTLPVQPTTTPAQGFPWGLLGAAGGALGALTAEALRRKKEEQRAAQEEIGGYRAKIKAKKLKELAQERPAAPGPDPQLEAAEEAWLAQKVAEDKKPAPKPAPDLQAGLMAYYTSTRHGNLESQAAASTPQEKPAGSSPAKPWREWITHEAARTVQNAQDTAAQVVRVIQRTSASIVNDINMTVSKALFTPEIAWQELSDAQYAEVLQDLRDSGPTGQATADYIEARGVRTGLYPQERSGAAWTWQGNIILPLGFNPAGGCLLYRTTTC